MEKVGFVGLGAMGLPMARNVRTAGYPLTVWNRTTSRCEPLRDAGASVAETPKELAGRSDVVFVMVTGPEALLAVIEGPDGIAAGLTAGKIVVNMSTVSSDATKHAAAAVSAAGGSFVDAPVSGSVKPAEDGNLVILASGNGTLVKRVSPILLTMGKQVVDCGDMGQGTRMKLVLNVVLGNMMQTLAESMVLGRAFGLEPARILEALDGGAMAAPMYRTKGEAIANGNFASQFPVHLLFKDLSLALEAAGQVRVPLSQTAATRESFNGAMARGLENEDMAAVVKVLEQLSGRTIR